MPGYVNYYYKDGKLPDHTKATFKEYEILTVHGVIIKNALTLMHKLTYMPGLLPSSIKDLFTSYIPKYGTSYDDNINWHNKSFTLFLCLVVLMMHPRANCK